MTLSLTCRRCNEPITGQDEDELVAEVQSHVRAYRNHFGITHVVSGKQVLARLRRQEAHRQEADHDGGTAAGSPAVAPLARGLGED